MTSLPSRPVLGQRRRRIGFSTIKAELLDRRPWPTRASTHKAIFNWIEGWYNTRRRHSTLDYLSPAAYEARITQRPGLRQVA